MAQKKTEKICRSRIRKGDQVQVVSGKSKGKKGTVLRVIPETSRIIVEKVNVVKRHQRPRSQTDPGGIVEKEASIHISNVMLVDPKSGKPSRIRMKVLKDGSRTRVYARSGETVSAGA